MPNPEVDFTFKEVNIGHVKLRYAQKINYKFGGKFLVNMGQKLSKQTQYTARLSGSESIEYALVKIEKHSVPQDIKA